LPLRASRYCPPPALIGEATVALAALGVERDGRPAQVQQAQPFGERRDFVALLFRRRLRQHPPRFGRKSAHPMPGSRRPVMAAPPGLTVKGNQARRRFRRPRAHKGDQYLLKGWGGVDGPQKPPPRIVAGNAGRKRQQRAQSLPLRLAVIFPILPALSPRDHSAQGHQQNLANRMQNLMRFAVILQPAEMS
jgi:hypothetical protein